ncbi:DgyrCDS13162 [Dimorphilus gyrociliatus]|uniref:DgyrCDS13162 n=1 Tax=Dimorphilus gyrociliatus TaxID=2664684 RepID=A0A7I8W9Y1_9ANNE|nr:DgyrCDS13162 [Dimorphilus gyrociliatus]
MNPGVIVAIVVASILALILIFLISIILYASKLNKLGNRKFCESSRQLNGITAIITGGNNGIGKETALDFAQRGAKVILACRNLANAETVKQELIKLSENDDIRVVKLDLSDLKSVRECAREILSTEDHLDIIVNNAGAAFGPSITKDKFHYIFGINYVGHFLLNYLLLELIVKSNYGRIVSVSSMMYSRAKTLDFTPRDQSDIRYPFLKTYETSKLAMILHMRHLSRLLREYRINTYSLHPGMVDTGIFQGMEDNHNALLVAIFECVKRFTAIDCKTGAQTQIHCAVDEEAGNETGLYYDNCEVTELQTTISKDENMARKLWEESCRMVSVGLLPPCLQTFS